MIEIIDNLKPFFSDCYRRLGVREYARIARISPPSASKILNGYAKAGLLMKQVDRRYHLFAANRENRIFMELCRLHWRLTLERTGLLPTLRHAFKLPVIIMYGSFSKSEITPTSDIDIAVFSPSSPDVDLRHFEKKLGRQLHLMRFSSRDAVTNKQLLNNILSGYVLVGEW
mgnify:CR=1 FL=1